MRIPDTVLLITISSWILCLGVIDGKQARVEPRDKQLVLSSDQLFPVSSYSSFRPYPFQPYPVQPYPIINPYNIQKPKSSSSTDSDQSSILIFLLFWLFGQGAIFPTTTVPVATTTSTTASTTTTTTSATTTTTTTATTEAPATTTEDPFADWTMYLNCRYRYFRNLLTYEAAKATCQIIDANANLAHVNIKDLDNRVALFNGLDIVSELAWIGATDDDGGDSLSNTAQWEDGTDMTGDPEYLAGDSRQCGYFGNGAGIDPAIFDLCTKTHYYICEFCPS